MVSLKRLLFLHGVYIQKHRSYWGPASFQVRSLKTKRMAITKEGKRLKLSLNYPLDYYVKFLAQKL